MGRNGIARLNSLLAAVLFLAGGLSGAAQVQPSAAPLAPVSRFYVLADLGERVGDPIWQTQQSLIADGQDGYLYTTSASGGARNYGTVFKFSPTDGKPPIVIYNF